MVKWLGLIFILLSHLYMNMNMIEGVFCSDTVSLKYKYNKMWHSSHFGAETNFENGPMTTSPLV